MDRIAGGVFGKIGVEFSAARADFEYLGQEKAGLGRSACESGAPIQMNLERQCLDLVKF
ncbi:MAG: hypothetical protein ACJA06_002366 [Halocynthiibacter sp.]|jgi:hypothetical protein